MRLRGQARANQRSLRASSPPSLLCSGGHGEAMSALSASIGIDIGGTKTLGVLLSEDGTVLAERRIDTSQDRHLLLQSLYELVADFGSDGSVGLGVPGSVRNQDEIVKAPNLPCFDGLTSSDFADSLGRPVTIGNDAKCAALAEWKLGAGVGARHLVLVTVGTGVGVGIVDDGRLALGASGLAGEFGHMIVDTGGPECACGQRGCWETFASGEALTRAAQNGVREGWLEPARDRKVRGEDLVEAVRRGVPEAATALDEFARWVSVGLINIVNALDPDLLVLAGGLSEASDVLIPRVDVWRSRLWNGFGDRESPELVPASLGQRAGALGAAILGQMIQ